MAMQKLRNINIDFSDRRTQLIFGGIVAVIIIVVVLFVVLRKPPSARPPMGPMMGMGGNVPGGNMPAGGMMPMGGNMPAGAPPMGMMGMGPMGMMGGGQPGAAGQGQQPAPTRKVPAGPPKEPSRADPFYVPIPAAFREAMSRIDIVPPPRITPLKTPMPTMVYSQVPFTRVAGIALSNGVYALLEGVNGRTYIVSPGDVLEGFTVERIEPDKVVLRSEEGEGVELPLKGSERGAMGTGPGMIPGAGMPGTGMPGMGMPQGAPGMQGVGMPGMGIPGGRGFGGR